jgi:hypothetical protein
MIDVEHICMWLIYKVMMIPCTYQPIFVTSFVQRTKHFKIIEICSARVDIPHYMQVQKIQFLFNVQN